MDGFTPIQSRILRVLSDGLPHLPTELVECLNDRECPESNIRPHLSHIREKLLSRGETIICEYANRRVFYRHVRLLTVDD